MLDIMITLISLYGFHVAGERRRWREWSEAEDTFGADERRESGRIEIVSV
jgi:hypothetical protein